MCAAASSCRPDPSIICSSLRRSRAAIVPAQAACTIAARSSGTTNIVRRMPSIRTSVRAS
jgi:hypothetical protein